MLWSSLPIRMIDFEGSHASGIVEFGVVTLLGGAIVAAQGRVCRARGRIRPEDAAIHGLDESLVAHAAPFEEEFPKFSAWRQEGPFAAHFANAENSLIKTVWPYHRDAPDFSSPGRRTADWGPWVDTGRIYPEVFGESGRGSLQELISRFGLQRELDDIARIHCSTTRRRYHAALYDALGAALLLLALGRREEFRAMTLPWLLQTSTAGAARRQALQQGEIEF
ncbi:MAG: 3'-5' exonuclease [Opitutaceae bacterium]|nr:3'-5' exonuclease [Opitutaceae bacterium]